MTMTQICGFWQMSHDVAPRLTLDWLQPQGSGELAAGSQLRLPAVLGREAPKRLPRGSRKKLPSPEMAKECPSTRSRHDINNINIQTFSHDMQFWPICETSPTHSCFVSGWQVGSCLIAVWAVPENERTQITVRVVQWCSMIFDDVQWSPFLLVKSH